MAKIPERRRAPDESAGMIHSNQPMAIAPNAAFARKVERSDLPLSVGEWLLALVVLAIPILNLVVYIYLAFFSRSNQGLINFSRASLILMVFGLLLALLLNVR